MKSSTNQGDRTITATEQKAGEAKGYRLIIRKKDGTVVERPLVDPVVVPVPPPPPVPVPPVSTVASVRIAPAVMTLKVGETATAIVTPLDATGKPVTGSFQIDWHSENAAIASWSGGVVRAAAVGAVRLLAVVDGVTGYLSVTVAAAGPVVPPPPDPLPLPPPVVVPPVGGVTPAVPQLPRSEPPKVLVGSGTVRRVPAGGDLQAALSLGGVILMAPGATFVGNFVLPRGVAGTLRTDIPVTASDAANRRITPSRAAALRLATITSPNSAPALSALAGDNPSAGWLLQDFAVTGTAPLTTVQYGLIALGDGGYVPDGQLQTTLARVPSRFVLDRLYIYGSDTLNCVRAVALNSGATAITSCWISGIHAAGFDSQAVCGFNGPGPYLLEDCYLDGAGENVMFGGADPNISGLVPSDITMRDCHFVKPLSLKGSRWSFKNLFELKSARRILLENCVLEHSWPASQEGMAVVIKSSGGGRADASWQGTTDLTMRWCIIRDCAVGLNMLANDTAGQPGVDVHLQRVRVEHCLFTGVGAQGGRAALMLLSKDIADIHVTHSTFLHAPGVLGLAIVFADSGGAARRFALTDSILSAGRDDYAFHYSDNVGSALHSGAFDAFVGDKSWSMAGCVVSGVAGSLVGKNPPNNSYPASVAAIGLAADSSLLPTSPYRGKATDGRDPGADIPELLRRTAGVVVPA